jgi:hypothetical protein
MTAILGQLGKLVTHLQAQAFHTIQISQPHKKMNGYALFLFSQEPDACIGEDNGFMLTWRKDDHYMECEILEDKSIELFYKQGNIIESEDGSLEQTFTEGMLKRMGTFVLGRAIA